MTIARKVILLVAYGALLALAACDGGPPATPTGILIEPGPTVSPEEAGVLPVRVMGRGTGMQGHMIDPQGTPFAILTPVANTTFKLEFTNNTGKDLKAWRGIVVFRDINRSEIEGFSARFEEELKAGSTATLDYTIVHTEHIPARQKLRAQPLSEMLVTFKPVSLTHLDGQVETIETPLP